MRTNYEKYIPPNTNVDDIWFEINKMPLKWNIPFGVLVDNLFLGDTYELPIHIIAHFRSFPEASLVRFKGRESLKFYYMNSLKEANTIKFGSSKEVLNLPTSETMKLLDIVFNNGKKSCREYKEIIKKIEAESIYKKLPVKIVLNRTEIVLNKPLVINSENSREFYDAYSVESFLIDNLSEEAVRKVKQHGRVVVHGLEVDLDFPILFLYLNMCYMDTFLYITIGNKTK